MLVNIIIAGAIILAIGLILGVGLAVANKYFAVEEDNRVEQIEETLPGYNCGACGYAGCKAMAMAIVEGKVTSSRACKVIDDARANKLKEITKDMQNNNGENISLQ